MISQILKMLWHKKGSNALLLLEIFLAFIALFGVYSYVVFSFDKLGNPLGFETKDKWIVKLDTRGLDSAQASITFPLLKKTLKEDDRVLDVAFINSCHPFSGSWSQSNEDGNGINMEMRYAWADEDLQKALTIDVIRGRWFEEADGISTIEPMIVNEKFMKEYYPDKNMVDSIINFNGQKRIVGVVKDYKYRNEFEEPFNTGFFYSKSGHLNSDNLILNMKPGTTLAYQKNISEAVASIVGNKRFVMDDLDEMRQRGSKPSWVSITILLSLCAFLCLNIALGLFGLMWYNIQKRKGELGLRRAIGAHSSDISWQIILELIFLVGISLTVGVFFAIQVPIMHIFPLDPSVFYKAVLLSFTTMMILVIICALYPARQASSIHPATALHED